MAQAAISHASGMRRIEAIAIYRILKATYPNANCELDFSNPLQLLVATVLSAQCTDKRVNQVTPKLFKKYKNAEDLALASLPEVEELIYSTGFYRTKARNLIGIGQQISLRFGGKVPRSLDELVTLPGVGRKTANVVLGHAFGIPGITVDTHFGRLSRRFGWSSEVDPAKVEQEVSQLFPEKEWTKLSQLMIWHGRRVCHARKPDCVNCQVASLCLARKISN